MNTDELKTILEQHKLWLDGDGGERANLRGANLRGADLQGADLQGAYLRGADLQGADLRCANLRGANLRWANLRGANLRWADLRGANLRCADLQGANIDYSCLPLWCGSKGIIVDQRIAAQIAAHFCALSCDDPGFLATREAVLPFAQTSHIAVELEIKEREE